jgi:hypothetical protein
MEYSEFKKKGWFADVEVFAGDFTDGITEGFKTSALYGDVTDSPFKMPTESPRDSNWNLCTVSCLFTVRMVDGLTDEIISSVRSSVKLIYDNSVDPLLPYFFFFFPFPTLPYCKQPAPPKKKQISLFSAQQVIFLEVLWSQRPCSDLTTDLISFCK